VLPTSERLVHRDDERNLNRILRSDGEVNLQRFVITFANPGTVVAGMRDESLGALQIVEKDEVPIGQTDRCIADRLEDEGADVEVTLPENPCDVPAV